VTENKIKDMVSAGEVSFEAVEAAFKRMSNEGGQFANMMGEQSKTLNGTISNLKDSLTKTSETIGMALLPATKKVVNAALAVSDAIQAWVEENPKLAATILKVGLALTGLLMLMGVAGLIMTSAKAIGMIRMLGFAFTTLGKTIKYVRTTSVTSFLSTLGGPLVKAFKYARSAVLGFNASMITMRTVLISTGIGALVVGIGWLIGHFIEVKEKVGSFGKTFQYIFLEAKKLLFGFIKVVYDAANAITSFFGVTNDTWVEVSNAMQYEIDQVNAKLGEMDGSMAGTGENADIWAKVMEEYNSSVSDSFAMGTGAAEEQAEAAKKYFDSIVDAVKDVRSEMRTVFEDYKQAVADFNKDVLGENKSYEGKLAETVAKAYDDRKKYERELRDELRKDGDDKDRDDIKALRNKIDEQTEIIESFEDLNLDLSKQISIEKRKLHMNAVELMTFEHKEKLRLMKEEHTQEQAERIKRLIDLKKEQNTILGMVSEEKQARIDAEIAKTLTVREQLQLQTDAISNFIGDSLRRYANYVASANATLKELGRTSSSGTSAKKILRKALGYSSLTGLMLSGRASGGAVQPSRSFIVGEKGPEVFTPETYGRINNGMGGTNITLIFKDNHFTDDEYADKIQRKIVSDLKNTLKLSIT
jgi:uncharacterized protein YecA (UPF0149 family)